MQDQEYQQLRESKMNESTKNYESQIMKASSNKDQDNQNSIKSTTRFPLLKKVHTNTSASQKYSQLPDQTILEKKQTDVYEKKITANTQNISNIKKLTSKRRISKKKSFNSQFKPGIIKKYQNYMKLIQLVNISNNLKVCNETNEGTYTLYVGKGNNGGLIRNIFRNWRPWWTVEQNDPQNPNINLHWHQLRQNSILQDFKSVYLSDQNYEYYLQDAVQCDTNEQKKQQGSICSNPKKPKRQETSSRSQSLIQRDHSLFSKTMITKRASSKTKINKSSEKQSRISPLVQKNNIRQLKQVVLENDNKQNMKKTLVNPKMWPIFYTYRRIFSALDMKKLKKMDVFRQDGSIHGKICRVKTRFIQNRSRFITMHNHLEDNWNLSNKKALFINMKIYYEANQMNPFESIPMTFHIQKIGDKQYENFVEQYQKRSEQIAQDEKTSKKSQYKASFKPKKRNAWLIKPGQNSNRGIGIEVAESLEEIKQKISNENFDHLGRPRTHILQEYILPFLYQKRKFDIRSYILMTSVNGHQKGYWYQDGYIRTASKQFNMKNLANKMIHLTNDAVQKKSDDYGKYEPGNKLSFSDFQRYLDANYNSGDGSKLKFWQQAYPEMKKLATDAIKAVYTKINSSKKQFSFEIFGLDFLIDQNFKIWLIQANTNPCLQLSSPLLGRLIPSMLQNAFKVAIDPIFPPPPLSEIAKMSKKILLPQSSIQNNKFQLVFDDLEDGEQLKKLLTDAPQVKIYDIQQQQDEYYEEDFDNKQMTQSKPHNKKNQNDF